VKKALSISGVAFFVCATLAAIRLTLAESLSRLDTSEAVTKAIAFAWPARSSELEQMLADIDPARAREALESAICVNPHSSAAWISLGLVEEKTGELAHAERSLLQAAVVDRQFLPAWTLVNFYFRRADREHFWRWADRAALLSYGDFQPLLRLCHQFEPDPARLLARFENVPRIRAPYLDFLIGENRLDAAQQVARGMADEHANDPHLIDLADRQLRAGEVERALELWNAASGFPRLDPTAGRILTNGDLSRAPLNLGFDWRVAEADGVAESWRPSELTFTFSGSQPETCVLLQQVLCLVPGRFHLRFDYTTGASMLEGVQWSLDNIEGPPIAPSSEWSEGRFNLPTAHGLRNLRLFYRREPGTTRGEGRLAIRHLRLEATK
jgi:tetratricopeptide (TPR) repeat protein